METLMEMSHWDLEQRKALSSVTRHSTRKAGKRCRMSLDIRPGRSESNVERDSTFDLEQQKALSSMTRHSTWNSRKRYRVWFDIRPGTAYSTTNSTVPGRISSHTRQCFPLFQDECRVTLCSAFSYRGQMSS